MRTSGARALAAVLALAAPSCTKDVCARNSECASGLVCGASGRCVVPPIDAAVSDGTTSPADATSADAALDAGTDATPVDATPLDAAIDAPTTDYETGPARPCPQMQACPPRPADVRQEPRAP